MPLTALAFWIVYISGVIGAVINPVIGVCLYLFVYHLNPESQWWGSTVASTGLRTSLVVAGATFVGIVLRRPRFVGGGYQFSFPMVVMSAFLALALLSLSWSGADNSRGYYLAEKTTKVFIFLLLMIRAVQTPEQFRWVVGAWILGATYIGFQAWGNVGTYIAGRLSGGLGGGDFAESSDLSVHLVATLPLISAQFFVTRYTWVRIAMLVSGALTVNAIVLTRTRNAIFGISAIALVSIFALPRGYRVKGLVGLVVAMLCAFHLTDPNWWKRMNSVQAYQTDYSAVYRLQYWGAAIQMSMDHPLGIGLGRFHERVQDYVSGLDVHRSAHSTYFELLAELGIIGLFLFLFVLALTLFRLSTLRRFADHARRDLVDEPDRRIATYLGWQAMAVQTSLVGYMACGVFATRTWAEDLWLLLGLAACLENVAHGLQHRWRAKLPEKHPVARKRLLPLLSSEATA